MEPEKKEPRQRLDGIVFVGDKPFMNYVTSVVIQLTEHKKVAVKARGKFISKAVDIALMAQHRFCQDAKIKGVDISSDQFVSKEGRDVRVSSISVNLEM
jgi:DNA-binding protein